MSTQARTGRRLVGAALFFLMLGLPVQGALASPRHDTRHYDSRWHHDREYPARGTVVAVVPAGHRVVHYGRSVFFFSDGVFFRPYRSRFVVVAPPVGIVVPVLPAYFTTVFVGGVPYYYADDTYYVWSARDRGYRVTESPRESDVAPEPAALKEIYIYPKHGQDPDQQARDRYECYRFAVDQTQFDPTKPLGGVSESAALGKRDDYQRAMAACLDARGYSVR